MKLRFCTLFLVIMIFTNISIFAEECIIPLQGNTYLSNLNKSERSYTDKICVMQESVEFNTSELKASSYVYINESSNITLYIEAKGKGVMQFTCCDKEFKVSVNNNDYKKIKLGKVSVNEGYICIDYELKSGDVIAKAFVIDGTKTKPLFINSDYSPYFGSRGPSCHLNYDMSPVNGEAEWAYIEVTVPEDGIQYGSYYCSLAFNVGYFGYQCNAPNRRMVIFSLWNAQEADKNSQVDEDKLAKLINKADYVRSHGFGGEGSGVQTTMIFPWQEGNSYAFLLHAEKVVEGSMDYSTWFYDCIDKNWIYIATIRRPHTKSLIRGVYSFLENYDCNQGWLQRKAYYHNCWMKAKDSNEWQPILKARLTNDDTGNKGKRVDFNGGVEEGKFFLQNCGYKGNGDKVNRKLSVDIQIEDKPSVELSKLTK